MLLHGCLLCIVPCIEYSSRCADFAFDYYPVTIEGAVLSMSLWCVLHQIHNHSAKHMYEPGAAMHIYTHVTSLTMHTKKIWKRKTVFCYPSKEPSTRRQSLVLLRIKNTTTFLFSFSFQVLWTVNSSLTCEYMIQMNMNSNIDFKSNLLTSIQTTSSPIQTISYSCAWCLRCKGQGRLILIYCILI
jgi:hypothetical protein